MGHLLYQLSYLANMVVDCNRGDRRERGEAAQSTSILGRARRPSLVLLQRALGLAPVQTMLVLGVRHRGAGAAALDAVAASSTGMNDS